MLIEEYINDVNIKKCVYGLGKRNTPAKTILEKLNISIDFVCDKNEDVLGNYNNRYKKMTLNELIEYPKRMIVFITIGEKVAKQAKECLMRNDNLIILLFDEFIKTDYVINNLFGPVQKIRNKILYTNRNNTTSHIPNSHVKIAIYTCITGNYELPLEQEVIEASVDYYFFTDGELICTNKMYNYNVVDISSVVPKTIKKPKERNRYIKTHGFEIFSNYDYSIYIDGNIKILNPIRSFIDLVGDYGLAMHKLTAYNITDPYEEALVLFMNGRIDLELAITSLSELAKRGLPRHCGVLHGSVIVCDNNSNVAKRVLEEWFQLYQKSEAKRDQFYLPYVLWKDGVDVGQIATLPGTVDTNGFFKIMSVHSGYQN